MTVADEVLTSLVELAERTQQEVTELSGVAVEETQRASELRDTLQGLQRDVVTEAEPGVEHELRQVVRLRELGSSVADEADGLQRSLHRFELE